MPRSWLSSKFSRLLLPEYAAIDPARIDLLFERFVSAERNEPPDIDVDFEQQNVARKSFSTYIKNMDVSVPWPMRQRSFTIAPGWPWARSVAGSNGLVERTPCRENLFLLTGFGTADVKTASMSAGSHVGLDS